MGSEMCIRDRYNITASPHIKKDFQGLPIPLAALFVASFIIFTDHIRGEIEFAEFFTPALVLLSWLMISNVKYSATAPFPNVKSFNWKVIILFLIVLALLFKPQWCLFPLVTIYILHGFIREVYWIVKKTEKEGKDEIPG